MITRRWRILAGALTMVALGVGPARAESVDVLLSEFQFVPLAGQRPPNVSLSTLDVTTVSLPDLAGRVVLLYFWATW